MRQRGFAKQMLEDFIEMYSDNDLGISDPITGNMLKGNLGCCIADIKTLVCRRCYILFL